MPVLKVKHVTIEAAWAFVPPLPIIPMLYSLVKGILILLSASHQQNAATSLARSLLGRNTKGHPIHIDSKATAVTRERARAGSCRLPCDLFLQHG